MKQITLSNTDLICVALRTAGLMNKEANRVKVYMEKLGYDERTAKRLDWFDQKLRTSGVPIEGAATVAAAWLANEEFYVNDGVNDWIWSEWDGAGGGDFKIVDSRIVPVQP